MSEPKRSEPPTGLRLWWVAARPRTLTISVAPVLAGTALTVTTGHPLHLIPMIAALVGAILIQVGTNLHNDVADALRGGDNPQRTGPPRITALGWASPGRVQLAAFLCFTFAACVGLALAFVGGWPILILGSVSLLAGWAYSSGPMPISHTPLGESFVIIFFGIGAVTGSAWLQTHELPLSTLSLGIVIGLPAAAVLMANNYRDAVTDRMEGRQTLAIILGPSASRVVYAGLMLLPFTLLPTLPVGAMAGCLALPLALISIRAFFHERPGPAFNRILARTAQCQLVMAAASAIGMMVAA